MAAARRPAPLSGWPYSAVHSALHTAHRLLIKSRSGVPGRVCDAGTRVRAIHLTCVGYDEGTLPRMRVSMGTDGRTGVGRPDGDDEDGDGDEGRLAYCTYIHSYITFQ